MTKNIDFNIDFWPSKILILEVKISIEKCFARLISPKKSIAVEKNQVRLKKINLGETGFELSSTKARTKLEQNSPRDSCKTQKRVTHKFCSSFGRRKLEESSNQSSTKPCLKVRPILQTMRESPTKSPSKARGARKKLKQSSGKTPGPTVLTVNWISASCLVRNRYLQITCFTTVQYSSCKQNRLTTKVGPNKTRPPAPMSENQPRKIWRN